MRVVVVSAHYPPDFVSGGTLVPQRLARGLRSRGHAVHVFAGSLDPSRPPLDSWDDVDATGLPVRWISTYPWTARADPLTADNPAVTRAFDRWLDTVSPDVVHLHSLQSLGCGLVEAAARRGARVVVTAHDFWWHCARQFLVDTTLTPCSLVVDAGACACEVDRSWLRRRNTRLAVALAAADVVLAPSVSAARVLEANGIPPERLRVDENGLPGLPDDRGRGGSHDRSSGGGDVRLLFTGGADPMKGWPVLRGAVAAMAATPGWRLSAYGVAPDATLPSAVTVLPPYSPVGLADVLAAHDLLVLPSLMRESHSLVTREALLAGLPVVCTDVLGPEEVVEHGVNGMIVPAGDSAALALTLSRLAADRGAVEALRPRGPVAIRPVEDQVLGLEGLYATLLAAPEPQVGDPLPPDDPSDGPVPQPLPRASRPAYAALPAGGQGRAEDLRRVLFVAGIQGAPLRYRVHLPAESLAMSGHEVQVCHYRDPRLPELAARADALVLYRVPATLQIMDLVGAVRRRDQPVPVLYDVDDLIFDPGLRGQVHGLAGMATAEEELWWRGVARYRTTMELADLYVGTTRELVEHAHRVTGMPTRRFANGVGTLMGLVAEQAVRRSRAPGPLRVGYFSGTTTHDADWAAVEPAVVDVLRRHGQAELWLGGHLTTTEAVSVLGDRVRRFPMAPWFELPGRLRDLDVNLAPLVGGSRFNEAKSAIKWSEAALVATVTIASPTEPFREMVTTGVDGVLADGPDEWATALDRLLGDPAERARMGARGRREVLLRLSPHIQARVYRQVLADAKDHLVTHGPRPATTDWEPVADDEPFDGGTLEEYRLPGRPSALRAQRPSRWGVLADRVVAVYREEGGQAVVRRGAGAVRRRVATTTRRPR